MKTIKFFLLTIFLIISGCGFHLRQLSPDLLKHSCFYFSPDSPWDPFQRKIQHLLSHKAKHKEKCIKIEKEPNSFNEQSIAFGADGQIHRLKVTLPIHYQLFIPHSKKPVDNTIQVQREIRINPNDLQSSMEEKKVIQEEMLNEAVEKFLSELNQVLSAENLEKK